MTTSATAQNWLDLSGSKSQMGEVMAFVSFDFVKQHPKPSQFVELGKN
ncbi:hypothetical protein [Moraxella marmotae]